MEEKTIIKGKLLKTAGIDCLIVAWACLALAFVTFFLFFLIEAMFIGLLIGIAFGIIAIIDFNRYIGYLHISIRVTNLKVVAVGKSKNCSIPIETIYNAYTSKRHGVYISAVSGVTKVEYIENNQEVCDTINRLVAERKAQTPAPVPQAVISAPQYAAPVPHIFPQAEMPVPQYTSPYAAPAPQPEAVQPLDPAEQIRKFKELYDSGVITQEEFEAKKKQLLGL